MWTLTSQTYAAPCLPRAPPRRGDPIPIHAHMCHSAAVWTKPLPLCIDLTACLIRRAPLASRTERRASFRGLIREPYAPSFPPCACVLHLPLRARPRREGGRQAASRILLFLLLLLPPLGSLRSVDMMMHASWLLVFVAGLSCVLCFDMSRNDNVCARSSPCSSNDNSLFVACSVLGPSGFAVA
jgi:hypothetical protein